MRRKGAGRGLWLRLGSIVGDHSWVEVLEALCEVLDREQNVDPKDSLIYLSAKSHLKSAAAALKDCEEDQA